MKYTTNEQWKPVNGYEDLYEVSNTGRVRSFDRVVFLKNRWGGNSKHTSLPRAAISRWRVQVDICKLKQS